MYHSAMFMNYCLVKYLEIYGNKIIGEMQRNINIMNCVYTQDLARKRDSTEPGEK